MANWANLSQDLLVRISEFCIAPDHIRMQYVCKSWGSILKTSIPREPPWFMMLPNEEEDPDVRVFYSLSKNKIHTIPLPDMRGKRCCGSFQSHGWLMFVDDNLDICLFHPWSKRRINLPHQSTFKDQNYEGCSMEVNRDMHIRKVTLSDDGSLVMFVYGVGDLAFCRIGDDDDAYTDVVGFYRDGDVDVLGHPLMIGEQIGHLVMEDVTYHKGYFYAVSKGGALYRILFEDRFHASAERLTPKLDMLIPYTLYAYLVPDMLTDRMFVVTRDVDAIFRDEYGIYRDDLGDNTPHKTTHFDIFAVPLEEEAYAGTLKTFTKVESLGDRVLFLGYNSSMIVMARQFPGLKGNHIYFADNMLERYYDNPYGCPDSGIFSLEDGTVEQLFADRFHPILSPPLWIATPPYSYH